MALGSLIRVAGMSSFALLFILGNCLGVGAQGLPQSPYSAPSVVRGGPDLAPSNPLSAPAGMGSRGMDSILLTPQMFQGILPQPSNLQAGYMYSFGDSVGSGRLTLDFIQPVVFGNSAVFGEVHGQFQNFWKTIQSLFRSGATITTESSFNERTDLSFGGGYRTLLSEDTLLGVNGFFDSTKLGSRWYSSGSVGVEYAALLPGNDALDLSFNWYGNLFNSNVLANAFRRGPQNYDFQVGYSHEMWNGGPDLRLSATGYRFSSGSGIYGFRGGAELKTRDGTFSLKYEAANDRVNKTYHTVGGFVNVGIQLSNLLNGGSPFVMPEPIFRSPRSLVKRLSEPARRHYGSPTSPTSVILSHGIACDGSLVTSAASPWANNGEVFPQPQYSGLSNGQTLVIKWHNIRATGSSGPNWLFHFNDAATEYAVTTAFSLTTSFTSGTLTKTVAGPAGPPTTTPGAIRVRGPATEAIVFGADGYMCFEFR